MPERAVLLDKQADSAAVSLKGTVVAREMLGSETQYTIRNDRGEAYVSKQLEDAWSVDQEVYLNVEEKHLYFFDEKGLRVRAADGGYADYLALVRRLS